MLRNVKTIDLGWCSILQAEKGEEVIPLAMLYTEAGPEMVSLWLNANAESPQAKEVQQEFYEKYYDETWNDGMTVNNYVPHTELMELCGPSLQYCEPVINNVLSMQDYLNRQSD